MAHSSFSCADASGFRIESLITLMGGGSNFKKEHLSDAIYVAALQIDLSAQLGRCSYTNRFISTIVKEADCTRRIRISSWGRKIIERKLLNYS